MRDSHIMKSHDSCEGVDKVFAVKIRPHEGNNPAMWIRENYIPLPDDEHLHTQWTFRKKRLSSRIKLFPL